MVGIPRPVPGIVGGPPAHDHLGPVLLTCASTLQESAFCNYTCCICVLFAETASAAPTGYISHSAPFLGVFTNVPVVL